MDQHEGKRIPEKASEPECFVRRIDAFGQILPDKKADQRIAQKTGQRTSGRMHAGRIGKRIDGEARQKRKKHHLGAGNAHGQFEDEIQVYERGGDPEKMNIVQHQNLNGDEYQKIKQPPQDLINHFSLPPVLHSTAPPGGSS